MAIKDWFRRKDNTPANPEQWLLSLLGGGPTVSGIPVGPDRSLSNSTVSACVQILSNDIAKIRPVLYSGTKRGSIRNEIDDHPASQVLSAPNPWMTDFDFWRFWMMNYLLDGNHYNVQVRNNRGELTELIPVPRGRTTIYQATDGELFYGVARGSTHEAYELQDFPLMIPSEYIIHDRGPSRDSIYGLSVISWHREAIGLAIAGEDHASRTFSAGARPSGVLQHPKSISDPARKRLKAEFDDIRGQAGALKTLLLEEGLDFKPITMSNVDVQFIESRRFQVEEIARIFMVPRTKLGDVENSRSNNIEQIEQQYVTTTLLAHFSRIESLLNRRLLTAAERTKMFFEYDLTELVRGDMLQRYQAYAIGRQWGWLSPDDIRNRENMNPIPNGKGGVYLQPVNMVPLGTPPPDPTASKPNDAAPGSTAPGTQPPGATAPPTPKPETPQPDGKAGDGLENQSWFPTAEAAD
jgi:HK97 family phage portal protein